MALVLIGSLYVISKGYAYKQKVDPIPEEEEAEKDDRKENQ
ncbi:YtzI protein [Virgibacillus oceani]